MNDKQAQTNIDVVQKALTSIAAGKIDDAMAQFEDDAKWHTAESLAESGMHEGRDAIRAMLGSTRERFRGGFKLLNLSVHGTHDHAFAEYTRASGDDAHAKGAEHCLAVFEVVMGKIRSARDFVHCVH